MKLSVMQVHSKQTVISAVGVRRLPQLGSKGGVRSGLCSDYI